MQSDEKILLLIQEIVKILKIEFFGFCEIKGWLKRKYKCYERKNKTMEK